MPTLNWLSVLVATVVYYVLGGLWFAPWLFGNQFHAGLAFTPAPGWRAPVRAYVVPFLGCLAATTATAVLARMTGASSLADGLTLGAIVGIGYGAAVAGTDAVGPTVPGPGRVAAVVCGYHVVGLLIVGAIVTLWSV
jgi:hypothetical protein